MASMLTQHGRFHVANGDYDDDDDICGSVRTSKPKEISRSVRPKYRITTSQRPMEKSTQAQIAPKLPMRNIGRASSPTPALSNKQRLHMIPSIARHPRRCARGLTAIPTHPIIGKDYSKHIHYDDMLLEWYSTSTDTQLSKMNIESARRAFISFRWGHCVMSVCAEFTPFFYRDDTRTERIGGLMLSVIRTDATSEYDDQLERDIMIRFSESEDSVMRRSQCHAPLRLSDMRYAVTDILMYHPNVAMAIFVWARQKQQYAWTRNNLLTIATECGRMRYDPQAPEDGTRWVHNIGLATSDYWKQLRKLADIKSRSLFEVVDSKTASC